MKIGGYAHSNGITFFCDVLKIKAISRKEKIDYKIDWIAPKGWLKRLEGKFLLGGLVMLYYQWKLISKELKFILMTLISLIIVEDLFRITILDEIFFIDVQRHWVILGVLIFMLINGKKIIRTLQYHGAEHKVINCYMKYGYLNKYLVKTSSKFNKRCGSNLGLVMLILYGITWFFNIYSILVVFFIYLISAQLLRKIALRDTKWDKYINILQWITVWEPKEEDIDLAINAFHKLQEAYHLYKKQISS